MSARTSTEVYRALGEPPRRRRIAFPTLAAAGVRAGCKRKLPLLLLYTPPAIATVIFSFVVYGKYAAMARMKAGPMEGLGGLAALMAERAARNLEIRRLVIDFHQSMHVFAVLAIAWFASGLVADDRRLGAHRLWFARPLTRTGYLAAKLLVAASFGALAVLVPGLVICLVAAWSSPDWSFLREEGIVVVRIVEFSALWIGVFSLITLAASSLAKRKVLALAGTFAFVFVSHAFGLVIGELQDDARFSAFSPVLSMRRIAEQIFHLPSAGSVLEFDPRLAWLYAAAVSAVSLAVVVWRLRRVEVVA